MGWVDGMANRCEPLINVVMQNRPKVLCVNAEGLNQKVCGPVQGYGLPCADKSGHRRIGGAYTIGVHARNVLSPYSAPARAGDSNPQGAPIGMRVGDRGESKRRPVMGRIRACCSARKRADFHVVSPHERTWQNG